MIEPLNKITCDWCGKFHLTTASTLPKDFFLLSIRRAPTDRELSQGMEAHEVEKVVLCTACRNAIQSVKDLRMKERRENKRSQFTHLNWSTVEPNYSVRAKACS